MFSFQSRFSLFRPHYSISFCLFSTIRKKCFKIVSFLFFGGKNPQPGGRPPRGGGPGPAPVQLSAGGSSQLLLQEGLDPQPLPQASGVIDVGQLQAGAQGVHQVHQPGLPGAGKLAA